MDSKTTINRYPIPKIRLQQKLKQAEINEKLFDVRIYALTDFDDNVFYVGCTSMKLRKRLLCHLQEARVTAFYSNNRKCAKIISLDFNVKIKELDFLIVKAYKKAKAPIKAKWLEEVWINRFVLNGHELTNCSDRSSQQQPFKIKWNPNTNETKI